MNNWDLLKISDLGKVVTGNTPATVDRNNYGNDFCWASPGDLGKTKYITDTNKKLSRQGFKKTRNVPKNSILVTCIGSTIGKIGMSGFEMSTNQQINSIIPNIKFDTNFIYYCIEYNFPKFLNRISFQAVPIISKSEFEKLELRVPNLSKQIEIGNTLSLIDKKLELQAKKIEALKLYKKGLSNKIFSSIDGEEKKLGEILNKWNIKNKDNEFEYVESVSNKYGFIPQSEQFEDRKVASADKSNYYVIKKNVFAYNPSRLDVGSLALKTDDKISLVSPLYECFTTDENIQYMLEWFNSSEFKYAIKSRFEGGVRNTLTFTNLATIEITIPKIEQQNKYASVFTTFNKKIKCEEERLLHLVEFKKGIMQNMFV